MPRRQPWGIVALIALVPVASSSAEPAAIQGPAPSGSPLAPAAPADSVERAPEQVVWLRSGAILRGQLVEYQPGERIVLQLATGDVRIISWSDVSRASFVSPSAMAPAVSAPAPEAGRPAASARNTAGGVLIGIHPANQALRLESRSKLDLTEAWQTQCTAPCNKRIAVEDRTFRIAGTGLRASNPFQVSADGKTAKLIVSGGTEQAHSWGLGLLLSGTVVGLASGALYGVGRLQDSDPAVIAGLVGMGLGAASVIASVPLLAGGRTTVRNGAGKHVASGSTQWPSY